jgi:microsomal prostaglandin-E synthase 1
MNNWLGSPTFVSYAIASVVLCCNLLFLWAYSGVSRNKVKSTPNAEDVTPFGATLAPIDPPEIARVLRAHNNAQASIHPFLAIGILYVLAGGPFGPGTLYFAVFCSARLLHSYAYLTAKQPWRTVFFTVGALATLALMVHVVWLLIAARSAPAAA